MGLDRYRDESLSDEERAEDLLGRMTLEEKASQLRHNAPAVKRLGIPYYNWWNEALHGVARAGAATVFPQPIGLAASFDDEFLEKIGDITATEGRAKYNEQVRKNDRGLYKGLTFWSPNINLFRDPRWGRGHETYGEDPYLTARMGVSFIKGLQGKGKRLKSAACVKHFAAHSGPEKGRHSFDSIVSKKDLAESYFPAFEACVREAGVEGVMGGYNCINGEPACGSYHLIQEILRDKWGFQGYYVSDCGAIKDFHKNHMITKDERESAALALKSGCDLNCGAVYLHVLQAYEEGLLTEEEIHRAAKHVMMTRMRLGMFDAQTEYDSISYEENDTPEHHQAALKAAEESMVLLKNDGILPLRKENLKAVAVIGPNADSREILKGNYNGTATEHYTILEGIRKLAGDTDPGKGLFGMWRGKGKSGKRKVNEYKFIEDAYFRLMGEKNTMYRYIVTQEERMQGSYLLAMMKGRAINTMENRIQLQNGQKMALAGFKVPLMDEKQFLQDEVMLFAVDNIFSELMEGHTFYRIDDGQYLFYLFFRQRKF